MGNKIISVIAGYSLWTLIWIGSQQILQAIYPDFFAADGSATSEIIFAALLVISPVASILSGMVTVKIANRDKLKTVYGLVAALFLTGLGVQIGYWDIMPLWYHIPFLVMLIPMPVLGARLVTSRSGEPETA